MSTGFAYPILLTAVSIEQQFHVIVIHGCNGGNKQMVEGFAILDDASFSLGYMPAYCTTCVA